LHRLKRRDSLGLLRGLPLGAAVALLGACSSTAWQEPPAGLASSWRDRSLHDAGDVFVLATSEAAAEDAVRRSREVLAVLAEAAPGAGGKGLVLALDRDDAPLLEDAVVLAHRMHDWHARASAAAAEEAEEPALFEEEDEAPGVDPQLLLRLVAFGVPTDDLLLDLPPDLRQTAAWIMVLPTRRCLQQAISALMSAGMEQAAQEDEIGFGQRMLMTLAMPLMKSEMNQAFQDEMKQSFLEVLTAQAEPDAARRAVLLRACKEIAGLPEEAADAP